MLPMAVDADLASLPLPDVPDKDIVAVYAKLVGELLYICINTVPEIMYALSALTRYMTRATSQHYGYDKQVLRYLKGVKHLKLTWCAQTVKSPFQRGQLFGFADASWADDKSSRRSTLCYVLCCNGAAFSWKSALAPILALSTSEAELISVASCAQEVNFCRKLTTELGFIQPGLTPIAEDNTGAIALFEHGHFKVRSKHVHPRVRLHRHRRTAPRSDPDTRPAHRPENQGLSCSSAQSSVLFFAVVFHSIIASPRASTSRRLSLLRAKWLLAHQTRLVLSTLPVSSALYSCILELRGGI